MAESVPEPPGPEQGRTGDGPVDAALASLAQLDPAATPAEHVRLLDEVHRALAERLAGSQA